MSNQFGDMVLSISQTGLHSHKTEYGIIIYTLVSTTGYECKQDNLIMAWAVPDQSLVIDSKVLSVVCE